MQQTPLTDALEWLAAREASMTFRAAELSICWYSPFWPLSSADLFEQTVPFERPEQASAALIRAVECGRVMEAKQ